MFRIDAEKAVSFCDGLNRRDFLHIGALSSLGLGITDFLTLKALGRGRLSKGYELYFPVSGGRTQSVGHLGYEARCTYRGSRTVQGHSYKHRRHADQRNFPTHGPARRQIFPGTHALPHSSGRT